MKKQWFLITLILLMLSSVIAMAQTVPDNVQKYAEEKAFSSFLELADHLHLSTGIKASDLVLGEGFSIHRMTDELFTASRFSDLIGDETMWLYLVNEPDGTAVSFLQIYDS